MAAATLRKGSATATKVQAKAAPALPAPLLVAPCPEVREAIPAAATRARRPSVTTTVTPGPIPDRLRLTVPTERITATSPAGTVRVAPTRQAAP